LPIGFTKAYVAVIVWVGILASNVAFTAAVRQLFSMARDGGVPFSHVLSTTRKSTPWVAVVVVAVITGIPLFFSSAIGVLATASTAFFYVVYFAVMIIVLIARTRGWPAQRKAFNLGRWGLHHRHRLDRSDDGEPSVAAASHQPRLSRPARFRMADRRPAGDRHHLLRRRPAPSASHPRNRLSTATSNHP
jgi:hypothetical protein